MKKIERRAVLCLLLAAALLLGLGVFAFQFVVKGGDWAAFSANSHLYNRQGQLAVGRVLDRDGDVLTWVNEDGTRAYYANETVRKATLHAVATPAVLSAPGRWPPLVTSFPAITCSPGPTPRWAKATTCISPSTPGTTTSPTML